MYIFILVIVEYLLALARVILDIVSVCRVRNPTACLPTFIVSLDGQTYGRWRRRRRRRRRCCCLIGQAKKVHFLYESKSICFRSCRMPLYPNALFYF